MTGRELFGKYISLRDFSGSEDDEYAQFLMGLPIIGGAVFELLEKAEKEGKKLSLRDISEDEPFDEVNIEDIILV